MTDAAIIKKYFPNLTPQQEERFNALAALYTDWNAKINVISRKDTDSLYERHVLHSLAIARVCLFDKGARIADIGCGGGFPSIPLSIMFPEAHFTAVDSIGKKITVVRGVAQALGLENLEAVNMRAEQLPSRFDYVVSRAVADSSLLKSWMWDKIDRGVCGSLPNGMLCLKGGDLTSELSRTGLHWDTYDISSFFDEAFFETKKVLYARK